MFPSFVPPLVPPTVASFPPRGPVGPVPPLQRYCETIRHPGAHFAALRFLRLAIPSLRPRFRVSRGGRTQRPRAWSCSPGIPTRLLKMETTGLPRFLESPHADMPCSSDPGGTFMPGQTRHVGAAFRSFKGVGSHATYFRGSITRPIRSLSTLRRRGHPSSTQDSLPAAGQLCRAGLGPAGLKCGVSSHPILPTQAWPGAMNGYAQRGTERAPGGARCHQEHRAGVHGVDLAADRGCVRSRRRERPTGLGVRRGNASTAPDAS